MGISSSKTCTGKAAGALNKKVMQKGIVNLIPLHWTITGRSLDHICFVLQTLLLIPCMLNPMAMLSPLGTMLSLLSLLGPTSSTPQSTHPNNRAFVKACTTRYVLPRAWLHARSSGECKGQAVLCGPQQAFLPQSCSFPPVCRMLQGMGDGGQEHCSFLKLMMEGLCDRSRIFSNTVALCSNSHHFQRVAFYMTCRECLLHSTLVF